MSTLPEIRDFKTLLEKYYKKNIEILQCKTKLLTAPGENYGSVMLAVDVTLTTDANLPENKQFVAKMCPANEKLCEIFNVQDTFRRELNTYMVSIPAIASFEEEFNIKENKVEDMFAKCFGGRINLQGDSDVVDKDAILLLEDLKVIGYDIGDRLIGFDLKHAELILKNLAVFHATSIALKLLKPKVFKEKVLISLEGYQSTISFPEDELKFMISEVTEVVEKNEKCIPYLEKLIKTMKDSMICSFRSTKGREPFATFVHTDFWVNNTMILKDTNGNPIHNKIVDLQLPIYNSGMHDVLFFLFTSVMPSVLYSSIDHFLKLYYDNFIKRLSEFDVDISLFSWEAFNNEIATIAPIELGHTLIMFKPILTQRGIIKDMANYDENLIYRKDIVSGDYQSRVLSTVLCYIERNWI